MTAASFSTFRRSDWQPPFFSLIGALMLMAIVAFVAQAGQPSTVRLKPVPDQKFQSPAIAAMLDRFECPPQGVCLDGSIVRVIDGDTVVVRSHVEYHIRLIDCWAPESRTKDRTEKQRGLAAKARMQALALDQPCRVFVPAAGSLTDVITMGRILGRVWILSDGQPSDSDLSATMIAEGLATRSKEAKP